MNAGFRFPVPDLRVKLWFAWDDARVALLRKYAAQKMSASEIAKEIGGGLTRSAVLGKAWRIGVKIDSGPRGLSRPEGKGGLSLRVGMVTISSNSSWTPARVAEMRALHARRMTDPEIADEMGPPFTATMVKSKRRRIGLASHGLHARNTALKPQPKLRPEPVEAQPLALTIGELRGDSCRWPLGDPSDDAFRYCGATIERMGVVSYCAAHVRMAYQARGGA